MRSTLKAPQNRNEFLTSDLNELERQLNTWRRRQRGRARLPMAVWDSAAGLARALGVSAVSRRLRLNHYKLSQRAAQGTEGPQDVPARAAFVELALAAPSRPGASPDFRAELSEPTRPQLTLHLGRDVRAVVALAEAFWRREP